MWSVNVNGAWYPVRDEREIVSWLRQGRVGRGSLVHRPGWPAPIAFADVPELQVVIAQDERAKQLNWKIVKVAGWGFAELVSLATLSAVTASRTSAAAILAGLLAIGIAVLVVGHLRGAPRFVRQSASVLARNPYLSGSWGLVLTLATGCGWFVHLGRVNDCRELMAEVPSLRTRTWPSRVDDALKGIDELAAKFKKGAETCTDAGMPREGALLYTASGALVSSKADVLKLAHGEPARVVSQASGPEQANEVHLPEPLNTLGRIVNAPRSVKPLKIETDNANNATDYEYSVAPFSEVVLSVHKNSPALWELGIVSSESPVASLATRAEKLCEAGGVEPFTWFELHGGPLSDAFAAVGAPDHQGQVHTTISSRLEMETEKVREEGKGAARTASIRDRLCETR